MGKKQKKVSAAVEERRKKKKSTVPLVKKNPFEVRVNRLKHQVLGQKIKTDKGVPGVSRSKSNEKVWLCICVSLSQFKLYHCLQFYVSNIIFIWNILQRKKTLLKEYKQRFKVRMKGIHKVYNKDKFII